MYITFYKNIRPNNTQNIAYTELLNTDENITLKPKLITIYAESAYGNLTQATRQYIQKIENYISDAYAILKPYENNYEEQYYTFKIPKRSGGLRTINAPYEPFKEALSKVKDIFENKMKMLSHPSAYAYIKNRSILDALKEHQANHSNWFLKLDLTDFFTNCTPEIIMQSLIQLYPICYCSAEHLVLLKQLIQICCLNGGLPQGTPISPILTNLLMIPFDYNIRKYLNTYNQDFVYTRYADDLLISSKKGFNWKELQEKLQEILNPFVIKKQKTRYGSKAGSNWNLGLMLNKDNDITLGSNKKKILNAMLNNFLKDYTNNVNWTLEDIYTLQGQLSWLRNIEPNYYEYMLQKYEKKYRINNCLEIIKNQL